MDLAFRGVHRRIISARSTSRRCPHRRFAGSRPRRSIEAQELAAEAWGAGHYVFLDSTVRPAANQMHDDGRRFNPGEKIAVPRNSHKSMLGGLVMSGAEPIYMHPRWTWSSHGPLRDSGDRRADDRAASRSRRRLSGLANLLRRRRGSRGGIERMCTAPVRCCSSTKLGPHFHFHPLCRSSATAAGADICINSTHKCFRHSRSARCCITRANALRSIGSKPCSRCSCRPRRICRWSHSLDVARKQMATEGEALLSRTIALAQESARAPEPDSRPLLFGEEAAGRHGIYDLDPTKVT